MGILRSRTSTSASFHSAPSSANVVASSASLASGRLAFRPKFDASSSLLIAGSISGHDAAGCWSKSTLSLSVHSGGMNSDFDPRICALFT